jgi:hypothetical protein
VAFDVFVSYASKDKTVADAVCARLESAGIRCWIAPRDILASQSYGEAIIDAIHLAKVMVLVFSSNANASGQVPKEVERAVSNGVPILPFRIEDVVPAKSLDYFIGSVHWLDAMTPPMDKHLDLLATTVHKLLPVLAGETIATPLSTTATATPPTVVTPPSSTKPSSPTPTIAAQAPSPTLQPSRPTSKKKIWIAAAALLVIAAIAIGAMVHSGTSTATQTTTPPVTNPLPVTTQPAVTGPISHPPSSSRRDPIVGCFQWFNSAVVVIRSDGTMTANGTLTGHWRAITAGHLYALSWPAPVDTLTMAADHQSMTGGNQYGPTSGARLSGTTGLEGNWRWSNNGIVNIYPGGAAVGGPFQGRWKEVDASRGVYTITWQGAIDTIGLLPGGARVSGSNQWGTAVSGIRSDSCSAN